MFGSELFLRTVLKVEVINGKTGDTKRVWRL